MDEADQAPLRGPQEGGYRRGRDPEDRRGQLGLKQLSPNIWDEFFDAHNLGDIVTGRISRLADFGVFVEIAEGVEGLVHVSELSSERVEHPKDKFEEGQEVQAKIIKMDNVERKIGLSIKDAAADEERSQMSSYMDSSSSDGTVRIGDVADFRKGSKSAEAGDDQEDSSS